MKRFEYRKMKAGDFRSDLGEVGMSYLAFSRVAGQDERRVRRWMSGEEDIPNWVPVFMAVLKSSPLAIIEARKAVADYITRDNEHPERGEYPFRRFQNEE